jgi:transcriptional regulator with XRE-family HTH domain
MKLTLDETIRKHRKALGLTQEQLAEAVGVTTGAVSKWESALSNPDIGTLIALADFFEVSVDVLLGYQLQCRTAELASKKIRELRNAENYEEGYAEVEKALQRFPNNFEVVYQSARFLHLVGFSKKSGRSVFEKALALYERACGLLSQNTDETISDQSIQFAIGELYVLLDDHERALRHFQKYNVRGINNATIGFLLAQMKQYEKALPYLSDSLLDSVVQMLRTAIGLANCYGNSGEADASIEVLLWMHGVLDGLKKTERTSYFTRAQAMMLCGCAQVAADKGDAEKTEQYLRLALKAARVFDAAPDFASGSIRFYHGKEQTFGDDFGKTAMRGIEKALTEDERTSPILTELWRKLINEEQ